MLVAVKERYAKHHPGVSLAVDQWFGTYGERAKYGLLQMIKIQRMGRSKLALAVMAPSFRKSFGLVTPSDLDAVLDASGFAFGDQHPAERTINFAKEIEAHKKKGKTVILLPQALGPFENPDIAAAFARVMAASDLVFARDQVSFDHATKAAGQSHKLKMAPDFTNLVKPLSLNGQSHTKRACIVPNQRMIEKAANQEDAAAYVPLLAHCIKEIDEVGLEPMILVHGKHDGYLVDKINAEVGRELPHVHENDPLEIKRILGGSHMVVASRFHALASALSQGVPCIATSWSHKYKMLFQDYECEELILPVSASEAQVKEAVQRVTGSQREDLLRRIQESMVRLEAKTKKMWAAVDSVLGLAS